MSAQKLTEAAMLTKLRKRHPAPAWAFFDHVADGTGADKRRTIDGLAMSLWPSRGLHLHGFEIKVDRGDWLRELKNPAKADDIASRCDFFWIAAAPDIVKIEELPEAWGLMEPRGQTMTARVPASVRDAVAIGPAFLAAILRRVWEQNPSKEHLEAAREEGREEARDLAESSAAYGVKREVEELQQLRDYVAAFEAAAGVSMPTSCATANARQLGEVAKLLRSSTEVRRHNAVELERQAELQEQLTENLRAAARSIRTLAALPKKKRESRG